jgi:hypothetical protein
VNLADVTTADLRSELGRRNAAKRKTRGAGTGRPVKLILCPRGCGHQCGVVAMRAHKCLEREK